ncbi:hypothetical protein OF83DRAFT_1288871 [Amylostereum chailletii]|nr:hypothetical protein OF83DRAFT_1288871 [Amylostereum chailletii]
MTIIAETPRISHPALFSSTAAVKGFANGTGDPYLDLPTPDGPPVPLHDLHPPFHISALSLLERSPPHPLVDAPAGYMASDDTGDPLQKDMAGKTPPVTLSDSAKHTGAPRQRPPSQPGPSLQPRRQPPMRPPFHNTPSSSSTGRENASNSPGPPGPPPTYPAPSPYPPSSFGQHRNSFVGPQYAMSTQQPSMSAMHSSAQYVYSHHPGMHDPSIIKA